MSVIKFSTYLIILFTLSSCGAIHKINMFFAACTGEREISCLDWGADVYHFKSKLKELDNYDELTSLKGIDSNNNKLRDDVEMFIDFYYKDKLGYPENYLNALRQYATMIDNYSRWAPSEELIKQFAKDNQETLNCSIVMEYYYEFSPAQGSLHYNQIRYWILKTSIQKLKLDKGYTSPSDGLMPSWQKIAPSIFLKRSCYFKIENYKDIFQDSISFQGNNGIATIRLNIKRFEKVYGTQYRDIYEHLLK